MSLLVAFKPRTTKQKEKNVSEKKFSCSSVVVRDMILETRKSFFGMAIRELDVIFCKGMLQQFRQTSTNVMRNCKMDEIVISSKLNFFHCLRWWHVFAQTKDERHQQMKTAFQSGSNVLSTKFGDPEMPK